VVFESTVFPGVTEDICGPLLEELSGLECGEDFTLGYSPERINPGDKVRRLETITKIISAQDQTTLARLRHVYAAVVEAGLHEATSIKVAEAAKVIENTQRDLNIALMNEVALIFDLMEIRTADVLAAAGTKWNFLPFRPGLVGGHCIGVDPYYLTAAAERFGYRPEVILAGRRINDSMGAKIAHKLIKMLAKTGKAVNRSKVGILGLTFKEDVPDLRNSKVPDIVAELVEFGIEPLIHDPLANADDAAREYGLELAPLDKLVELDALIFAVSHAAYLQGFAGLTERIRQGGIFIDVKAVADPATLRGDIEYWSL
jgi:UDP-N-acetyl-D-galactosamine dehydrogenase